LSPRGSDSFFFGEKRMMPRHKFWVFLLCTLWACVTRKRNTWNIDKSLWNSHFNTRKDLINIRLVVSLLLMLIPGASLYIYIYLMPKWVLTPNLCFKIWWFHENSSFSVDESISKLAFQNSIEQT
jgi:hypothetical protein